MWTRPSWCTPISTNAPKFATLVTTPSSTMPGYRSFSVSTPSLNWAVLNSGRGSRPGFSSSAKMSRTVGRPKRSSVKSDGDAERFALADDLLHLGLDLGDDALDHRIGFRVHRGCVQRIVAVGDAQEAGGLLEGLVAEARHLEQHAAGGEGAVLIAPGHDVLGQQRVQARHARSSARPCSRPRPRRSRNPRPRRPASAPARAGSRRAGTGTPMALGSILTSSARGSCRRRAIDTAPRSVTSRSGNSCAASSDAE